MGLFDVNMPVIYGEGRRAFIRLQEEIYKYTNDLSLFAWQENDAYRQDFTRGLDIEEKLISKRIRNAFAKSPADFTHCGAMFPPLGVEMPKEDDEEGEEESLWDSMSTTSTLIQTSADAPTNQALNYAIALLRDDPDLFPLFQAAIERPGIGVDKFRRILCGILRSLAIDLSKEATDDEQHVSRNILCYSLFWCDSLFAATSTLH